MKTAVLVSFVLAVVVVTVSVDALQDQTRIIGSISPGDTLLDHVDAHLDPTQGKSVVFNHRYPKWGWWRKISCIQVIDQWRNGLNGDLYLNGGGVGSRSVSMTIRSKVGYGLRYRIDIYGR